MRAIRALGALRPFWALCALCALGALYALLTIDIATVSPSVAPAVASSFVGEIVRR